MPEIRITFTGLIAIVAGLITTVTGLVFVIIITRILDPTDFGTWAVISAMFLSVLNIEPIISYWATREISRGIESAKTAIFANGILSSIAVVVFLIIAYVMGTNTNTDLQTILAASLLVPLIFLNKILTAINLGWKPHVVSYSLLVYGITQIPMALIFVYYLDLGIYGIFYAVGIANLASIILLTIYGWEKIKSNFEKKFLKKWFKFSWLPFYPGIAGMIHSYDVILFSLIVGTVEGIAFWAVATLLPTIVVNAGHISSAVYPKLLKEGKIENLQQNITLIFYFGFPLSAIAIVFAKPGLFILNPIYEIVFPIVIILTFWTFLNTLSTVFQNILKGTEIVDVDEKNGFMAHIKSKLIFLPTLLLVQYIIYISALAIMLFFTYSTSSQFELLLHWSLIYLLIQIPFTLYHYIMVRKETQISFEFNKIIKYFLISLVVFSSMYFIMEQFLNYENNIFIFIPNVLFFVIIGIFAYISISFFIDDRIKQLVLAIIKEIKK